MKLPPNPLHRDRRGARMHAIRQQHHDPIALRIDPDRGAGEAGVAVACRFGATICQPRPRDSFKSGRVDCAWPRRRRRAAAARAFDPRLRETEDRARGREEAGVAGGAAGEVASCRRSFRPTSGLRGSRRSRWRCAASLRFEALAPFGRGDARTQRRRRMEHRVVSMPRGAKIRCARESRVVRQHRPEQDEVEVGVDDARARLVLRAVLADRGRGIGDTCRAASRRAGPRCASAERTNRTDRRSSSCSASVVVISGFVIDAQS